MGPSTASYAVPALLAFAGAAAFAHTPSARAAVQMQVAAKERSGVAKKRVVVESVSEVAAKAVSVLAAEYKGLTVNEMTELRQEAAKAGVHIQVVRNSLAKRALTGTEFECIMGDLKGPLFLAFSLDDHASAAKVVKQYVKENENAKEIVKVRNVALERQLFDSVDAVLDLSTREESMAKIVAMLQSPAVKVTSLLKSPAFKVTRQVQHIANREPEAESEQA